MTPVLWLDPVAACAVANDCTRFGGQVPGHTRGSNWDWVPCGDCNGTGLVQPSGPQTMLIGATADMSDDLVYDYQDHLAAVDGPADVVWTSIGPHWGWHLAIRPAGEEWTSSNTTYRPIHPASILGTATVAYEINEALPFGPWTPGGPAAIVTDYRDTIDCPNRVDVERDGCGKWWVTLDGTRVSDHRDHVAARTAARRHPLATTVACPLPWPAAPSSPCVTSIDLAELGAA